MAENKSDAILKQIKETYIDTDLRLAMYHLDMVEVEEAEAEIEALKGDSQWAATEEEQKLVFRTVDKVLNRSRLKKGFLSFYQITSKVSVFLLVFVIGLGVAAFSVEAIRVPLIEWLVNVQEKFTEIRFSKNNPDKGGEISFGYLPEGYQAVLTFQDSSGTIFVYTITTGTGNDLTLLVGTTNSGLSVDTEDAEVHDISVNGNKAMLIQKNGENNLIWKDNRYFYSMIGTIDKDVIIKISENINK